jgi:hypothetical protein
MLPPASVGHTPMISDTTSMTVAMRTFQHCDVEPVRNQIFAPVVVYKKKHIEKKPEASQHSPMRRKYKPK